MDGSCSVSVFLASAWAHDHFCNIPFIRNQSPRTAHLQEEKSWASSFEGVLSKNLGMYFSLFHQWLFCRQLWFWGAHERRWAQGLSTPSSWLLSPRTYFKTLSYHRNNDRCMTGGLGVESLMSQCLWSLSLPSLPLLEKDLTFPISSRAENKPRIGTENGCDSNHKLLSSAFYTPHPMLCVRNKELMNINLCSRRPDV